MIGCAKHVPAPVKFPMSRTRRVNALTALCSMHQVTRACKLAAELQDRPARPSGSRIRGRATHRGVIEGLDGKTRERGSATAFGWGGLAAHSARPSRLPPLCSRNRLDLHPSRRASRCVRRARVLRDVSLDFKLNRALVVSQFEM